jgi:DNA polymerase-3 subunit alpha
MVKQAVKFKMPALAITDHGNLFGAIEFYKTCNEHGINPIIGVEAYVAVSSRKDRTVNRNFSETAFHLTLLCEDYTGYQNMIKLISLGYTEGFYYRPRIDKEILSQYSKGLIALSGCLKGEINQCLLRDDPDRAQEVLSAYQNIFGKENFYLELTRLGMPDNEKSVRELLRLSQEMGAGVVATNDCHYLDASDLKAHDALICLQTGKKITEHKRLKFESTEIYFKSPEQMTELFQDIPEAIANTRIIADRCRLLLEVDGKKFFLPEFPIPETAVTKSENGETVRKADEFEYLVSLTRQGLKEHYPEITSDIEKRLNHELKIIGRMGFAGYFLIVKDIIDFARSKNIPVGPGRGSAVSSLVLYTLGITGIDPLQYGLIFERFLNPDRITLPDIDIDFADNRRAEIIEYIRQRYGNESVAQIITFGTMASRAVVRDVGRVLDISYGEVDRIAKLIPYGMEIAKAMATTKELRELIESSPKYQEIIEIAEKLEGLARHASIHASGVVIAPKPLTEFVPLYRTADDEICTQYDMNALADVGLLKMDILGLRTLSVIEDTLRVCSSQGIKIDKKSIPFDDPKTYQLLQRADTTGLFQLESEGMRDILRRSKPEKIEDVCAVIALYRPGPMANIDEYISGKLGHTRIKYLDDSVKPILQETYGIMVYQEQVMQIAAGIAGFTPTQYDRLRKAMGKKIAQEMEAMRESFVEGAVKKHFTQEKAEEIFELIAPFAGYGFNKSHSIGYAHLSYITAYLKANYPLQFMTALLTSEINNSDKLDILIKDLQKSKIEILPPDINHSNYEFTTENNKIRYGMGGIKHLGQKVCESFAFECKTKPYISLRDLLKRTRNFANRKAYEFLIKAGALDSINQNRTYLLSILEDELEKIGSERLQYLERQNSLFGNASTDPVRTGDALTYNYDHDSPTPKNELLTYEKEAFGFYFSCHPLENFQIEYNALGLQTIAQLDTIKQKSNHDAKKTNVIHLAGVVTSRMQKKDRKGQDYAIFKLEDFTGKTEIIAFNDVYSKSREFLRPDVAVIVRGRMSGRDEIKTQVEARAIIPFTEWHNYFDSLVISIKKEDFNPEKIQPIKNILEKYQGPHTVYFKVRKNDKPPNVYAHNDPGVKLSKALIQELTTLINPQTIRVIRQKKTEY